MTETLNREYFADGLPLSIVNYQLSTPNHAISFDADTIANALVNIYQKKYGNGRELEPTLFEKTKEILGGAVNKGWNAGGSPANTRSSAFIDALRHNTDVFSAFRTHKMQSDIAAQLLDSKGKLKPFGQFVKDVKPYITHQNRAWLQTEYDTAVLRAHQAADWKQFEAEKDVLPNLEWLPSTSPHPGEDHRPYWGTVLPIDHKFWNNHRPGDRWNCKCRLRNTDKEPTAAPAETLVKNLQPSKGLESNPGKTGEIFSNSHPYYPENCGKCPFNKGVGKLFAALVGTRRDCNRCKKVDDACVKELIKQRKKDFFELREDENYINVKFDKKTGALMAEHIEHIEHVKEDKFFGNKYSSTDLERECQKELFLMGHKAILLIEKEYDETGHQLRALDLNFNNKPVDIASVVSAKKYGWKLVDKNKQIIEYNDRKDITVKADSVILYFHDPTMFSEKQMQNAINFYKHFRDNNGNLIEHQLKTVHCVLKGANEIKTYHIK